MGIRAVKYCLMVVLGVFSFQVNAGTVACNNGISGLVDGAVACEVSTSSTNDLPKPGAVNDNAFFGITDWQFAGKLEETNDPGSIGFDGKGLGQSGSFSLDASAFNAWDSIMLIFKDGATTYITGYLLDTSGLSCDGTICSGNWFSPFVFPYKIKSVSHISAYVSTSAVPIPAAVWLLGSGLLGLLGLSQRTKHA